jgi:hypothetical protein
MTGKISVPGEHTQTDLVSAFLNTVEHCIVPLTAIGVASGNKVFGAAILRKDDWSLVIAATNQETNSPLLVSLDMCSSTPDKVRQRSKN